MSSNNFYSFFSPLHFLSTIDTVESPEFELCNRTWQLRIFPGGSLTAHRGYLSYYLASKSTVVTRASYKLIIVRQHLNTGMYDCTNLSNHVPTIILQLFIYSIASLFLYFLPKRTHLRT